jgi:hypothetical protein
LSILSSPALATAGSYEGTIQGFWCVTQGKVCPVGKEDPVAAAENVFVLHVKADKYYFIPNLDRGIMARHINEKVRVEGVMSPRFNAIKAADFYVDQGGKWKKTWSQNKQDEIYYEILSGFPLDGS